MARAQPLMDWYGQHARDLPWRRAGTSSWAILLSEIILQQTRMDTGIPYWERIHNRWPSPQDLAAAPIDELLLEWQGCGYYARARNLHKLALELSQTGGQLPESAAELKALPGVGPYTAAAVASIAFGERIPCVDGNVRRVLSRWNAQHFTDAELAREAQSWMDSAEGSPGDWNQAVMELGAIICKPRNPGCPACPMKATCKAAASEDPTAWPQKRRVKQKEVHMHAWVAPTLEGYHLVRSDANELGGLWGFPLHSQPPERAKYVGQIRHDFTHKRWTVDVHLLAGKTEKGVDPESVGMSRLHQKILGCIEVGL